MRALFTWKFPLKKKKGSDCLKNLIVLFGITESSSNKVKS